MHIISQLDLQKQLELMGFFKIKSIIKRQRLHFSITDLSLYLHSIFIHQSQHISFVELYRRYNLTMSYQAFMKDIATVSPLVKSIFYTINKKHNIKPSSLYNIVDTSLLPSKLPDSIRQTDFDSGRVTIRQKEQVKVYICGQKLLCFINRKKQIYYASLLKINISDQNILKDSALYQYQLKGFLLADKGFNCKLVSQRVSAYGCKILSPAHYKSKIQLTDKERKFYKHRCAIESTF